MRFQIHAFWRQSALWGCLALASCVPSQQPPPVLRYASTRQTLQVQMPAAIPAEIQTRLQAEAQVYADQVSKRRGIDLFYLHPALIGLKFQAGAQEAWLLSFLGTSRLRSDLNLELRALSTASHLQLNLNYSGPVTLGRSAPSFAPDTPARTSVTDPDFSFELITGLPGNGLEELYTDQLERQAQFLRQRFQARPFSFDEGPLIYALKLGQELQGFVFLNQRNRLTLGERKYADLQSVVFISTAGAIEANYTLVAFNPKTSAPDQWPVCTREAHAGLADLLICGDY